MIPIWSGCVWQSIKFPQINCAGKASKSAQFSNCADIFMVFRTICTAPTDDDGSNKPALVYKLQNREHTHTCMPIQCIVSAIHLVVVSSFRFVLKRVRVTFVSARQSIRTFSVRPLQAIYNNIALFLLYVSLVISHLCCAQTG